MGGGKVRDRKTINTETTTEANRQIGQMIDRITGIARVHTLIRLCVAERRG